MLGSIAAAPGRGGCGGAGMTGEATQEAPGAAKPTRRSGPCRPTEVARELFLDHLAASAHVIDACAAAGFGADDAYALRRRDPKFANEWRMALLTGYDRIEAALIRKALGCRDHAPLTDSAATGVAPAEGGVDVMLAIQLLDRHRAAVTRAGKDVGEPKFRATRDAAAATLLTKLKAHAKRADARGLAEYAKSPAAPERRAKRRAGAART